MDDERLMELIEALVAEEHRLLDGGGEGGLSGDDRARLDRVTETLDRAWDLMRQRRALEESGRDPGEASPRPAATVEGYEQ